MRIVFMGTPEFAVRQLSEVISAGHDVVLVVTAPDRRAGRGRKARPSPVKTFALESGLAVITPEEVNAPDAFGQIAEVAPDTIAVAAFVQKLGKALLDLKIDTEVRLKVSEMLDRLGETQDRLFQLREDLEKIQADNRELREQLAAAIDWKSRLEKYSLVKTEGGAIVYQSTFEPKHYVCPSCIENRSIHPLQDTHTYGGSFVCPKCDKRFPIRKPRRPPKRKASIEVM